MTDEQEGQPGALEQITDAIGDLVTGIPAPIRKRGANAIGRLVAAAVDWPTAYFEGKAEDIRANTRARGTITDAAGKSVAERLKVPEELVEAAAEKFGEKIVREQINLNRVGRVALLELQSSQPQGSQVEQPDVDEDWLNAFEREARDKSSEEMQLLFGKILAGEISRPSTFSIKAVRTLAQLDGETAEKFRLLCSLTISYRLGDGRIQIDSRVPSLGGDAAKNALAEFGLGFGDLNNLLEHGLVIPDFNSYMDYRGGIAFDNSVQAPIGYSGKLLALKPLAGWDKTREFRVHGVALSKVGRELQSIVDVIHLAAFDKRLSEYLRAQGLEFAPVSIR